MRRDVLCELLEHPSSLMTDGQPLVFSAPEAKLPGTVRAPTCAGRAADGKARPNQTPVNTCHTPTGKNSRSTGRRNADEEEGDRNDKEEEQEAGGAVVHVTETTAKNGRSETPTGAKSTVVRRQQPCVSGLLSPSVLVCAHLCLRETKRRKERERERRKTKDERRKTKDERRKTKDERRKTKEERRKKKDERRKKNTKT